MTERKVVPEKKRRSILAALLIVYWVTLFVATHIPMPDLGDLPPHSDKLMHFVAYGGLSFLLGLWWTASSRLTLRTAIGVFAVTVVYAVVDELLQTIPALHRSGDPYDALADACGSVLGLTALAAAQWCYRRLRR